MEEILFNLDLLFSVTALIMATLALVVALQCRRQLKGTGRSGNDRNLTAGRTNVYIRLVKHPSETGYGSVSQDYRFWITNNGDHPAYKVNFEIDSEEPLLFDKEVNEKLPCAVLKPGETIELCSRIALSTPKKIRTLVSWENPDGTGLTEEFWVSKEVDESA